MPDAEVVTYATHAQGKFSELVNNDYDIPIRVIGWGDTWISYTESKAKGVYNYIKTLPKDKLIIYVDGFDTVIRGTLDEAVKRFKTFGKEIVLSNDNPRHWGSYIVTKTFGSCQETTVNAGLFMGYAGAVSEMLQQIISSEDEDDQRAMNTVCSTSSNIAIDSGNLIFANNDDQTNAIFIGFPGCSGCDLKDRYNRYRRDVSYYIKILRYDIIAMLAISFGLVYFNKNIKCKHLPFIIFVMLLVLKNIPASLLTRSR